MNKTSIGIIVAIIIIGGFFVFSRDKDTPKEIKDITPVETLDTGKIVTIQGHKIPQGGLQIEAGTTVVWENKDNLVGLPYDKHTITSGSIDSSGVDGVVGVVPNSGSGVSDGIYQNGLALGESFEYTFDEPGVYTFYIAEHPTVSGEGIITVTEKIDADIISMESKSFAFSPETLQGKVGEIVSLDITSTGQHTFTIDELGVNVVTKHGETTRVEFVPDKAGIYEYYCAIPGHKEAGQVGVLTVVE